MSNSSDVRRERDSEREKVVPGIDAEPRWMAHLVKKGKEKSW
jgi:hypothetical protein